MALLPRGPILLQVLQVLQEMLKVSSSSISKICEFFSSIERERRCWLMGIGGVCSGKPTLWQFAGTDPTAATAGTAETAPLGLRVGLDIPRTSKPSSFRSRQDAVDCLHLSDRSSKIEAFS